MVLLDLSADFDTVDHATLHFGLESTAGITSSALQWISSYIHNRTQSVSINGTLSSKTVLLYGVPQGSVLGPQFFIIYTGPIAGIAKKHGLQVHLYADDIQLYVSFNPKRAGDEQLAVERIQNCIHDIKQWMRANKLKLNYDKTADSFIKKSKKVYINSNSVKIGISDIQATFKVRNLGIIFDDSMSMQAHVKKICQTAYFHLRININSIRKLLSQQDTENL